MITVRNLGYTYSGGNFVFENLSFTLAAEERVALEGANGSGKTTLMHIIMGLLKEYRGELIILGKQRKVEADFLEVRQRIGMLFQDSDDQLFCPTVDEDITFGPLNLGMKHDEARQRTDEVTRLLNIEHLRDKVTHRLSGGEKRMVAFATIFAMRPECYLLDEPTSGLDSSHTESLLRVLYEHTPACLITSHDKTFLREATSRSITLTYQD